MTERVLMDDIQIKAVNAIKEHMNCLESRNMLRGILSDYLLDDKMHINLILNAYDDEFHLRIRNAEEKSLVALQFIKILVDDYGISEKNAKWSVEVWCAVLGFQEVADALCVITSADNYNNVQDNKTSRLDGNKIYEIGIGVYCAGIDFPCGRLVVNATWKKSKDSISFYTGNSLAKLEYIDCFTDRLYIDVAENQLIKFG